MTIPSRRRPSSSLPTEKTKNQCLPSSLASSFAASRFVPSLFLTVPSTSHTHSLYLEHDRPTTGERKRGLHRQGLRRGRRRVLRGDRRVGRRAEPRPLLQPLGGAGEFFFYRCFLLFPPRAAAGERERAQPVGCDCAFVLSGKGRRRKGDGVAAAVLTGLFFFFSLSLTHLDPLFCSLPYRTNPPSPPPPTTENPPLRPRSKSTKTPSPTPRSASSSVRPGQRATAASASPSSSWAGPTTPSPPTKRGSSSSPRTRRSSPGSPTPPGRVARAAVEEAETKTPPGSSGPLSWQSSSPSRRRARSSTTPGS